MSSNSDAAAGHQSIIIIKARLGIHPKLSSQDGSFCGAGRYHHQSGEHNVCRIQSLPGRSHGQGKTTGLCPERDRLLHNLRCLCLHPHTHRGRWFHPDQFLRLPWSLQRESVYDRNGESDIQFSNMKLNIALCVSSVFRRFVCSDDSGPCWSNRCHDPGNNTMTGRREKYE